MNDHPDRHHRRTIHIPDHIPGNGQPPIIVQTLKLSDIQARVFSPGLKPDGPSMRSRIFEARMFDVPFLSDDELIRVNRFKALKKQMEWICGRFALKTLAKDILDSAISLDQIRIDYREKGAPYLTQFPEIPISLSHSGDYTAAAITLDTKMTLGIDIEKIGTMPDQGFMKTAFTKDEIRHMPAGARAVFYNWTLKEAFLKFLGLGFNESLHHVAVIKDRIYHCEKIQIVHTWSCFPDDRYVMSLVYGRKK
ncbi:MAG: 4'-phosphopantetheinyl transferase superfamily protein [Desulfotignum sp.]|nr:4'-phosphopantetheinyl transferase superfamily protein [Desulfotignum sp.]